MDRYNIDGKKVTKTQWYEHLEKLYIQQAPYAELGRLAVQTKAGICGIKSYQEYGCENNVCFNQQFCQKRAELLAEGCE